MFQIELSRFFGADELRDIYKFPPGLWEKIQPVLPVAYRGPNGEPYYLEGIVDRFLYRMVRRWEKNKAEADRGPGGPLALGLADDDRVIPPDKVRIQGRTYGPLTAYEWRLLQAVLNRPGVTIQRVMEHVYGHGVDDRDNALKQVIKRLNKKLLDQTCPLTVREKNGRISVEA